MLKLRNFDTWEEYTGFPEGSGRSEKIWLTLDGKKGLFKFPKTVSKTDLTPNSTEYISEHLAHQIARVIGVPCAKVEIGYRDGRIGCMSHSFCGDKETLLHGVEFITHVYPSFNPDTLYDEEKDEYYSYDMIINAMEAYFPKEAMPIIKSNLIVMMMFDMLIGNKDRHQQNWGLLRDEKNGSVKFTPLYDNGSSLCAYIREQEIENYLGNDLVRFSSLTDSKSTSRIRINGKEKKEPRHSAVLEYLCELYPGPCKILMELFNSKITPNWINSALSEYPDELLSKNKKELIKRYLLEKMRIMNSILDRRAT